MSKSNSYETSILGLLLTATPIANIADNAASSPLTNLYVSLHTSDPGEAADQTTNECAYTSYARVAVARSGSGFVVTGNTGKFAADVVFTQATGGSETATHFGIGSLVSGAGVAYYTGTLTPNIIISNGVTPRITAATTTITED